MKIGIDGEKLRKITKIGKNGTGCDFFLQKIMKIGQNGTGFDFFYGK